MCCERTRFTDVHVLRFTSAQLLHICTKSLTPAGEFSIRFALDAHRVESSGAAVATQLCAGAHKNFVWRSFRRVFEILVRWLSLRLRWPPLLNIATKASGR
jgi:hypothetical protein